MSRIGRRVRRVGARRPVGRRVLCRAAYSVECDVESEAASDAHIGVVAPTDAGVSADRAPRGVTRSQKVGAPLQCDIKRVRLI